MGLFKLFICILCASGTLAAADFVVGTTSGYAPFVSLTNEGDYEGFDIDIARRLAEKLGRNLVIKDLGSMPSLFIALKQNKVDAIIWAISITEERQNRVEMVYYQGKKVTSLPLLFWQQVPPNVKCLEDLAMVPNSTVTVEAGSFQESVAKQVPGLTLKQVDKVMDAILDLKYKKATATLIDPALLSKYSKQFPELQIINTPLKMSQASLGNGICLNKENVTLIAEVKQVISELTIDGEIATLEQKWNIACTP